MQVEFKKNHLMFNFRICKFKLKKVLAPQKMLLGFI